MNRKAFNWKTIVILVMIVMLVNVAHYAYAESPIKLIVDGKAISAEPEAFIKNDRTLVPLRVIAEELGADVQWDNDNRKVHISKEEMHVALTIDSYLIEYTVDNETKYNLSDVAPLIKDDRTFVPIRLVSNALGVGIDWDNDKRAVIIDSSEESQIEPFFDVKISSVKTGQVINGKTNLSTTVGNISEKAAEIKYLILDKDNKKGFIVAKGSNLNASYTWLPQMEDEGEKILVAAIYDENGSFLAGDSIPVVVDIIPEIKLTGLKGGELVTADSVPLGASLNFTAAYVQYEIINPDTDAYYISPELDPLGGFTMIPVMEDNGNMSLRVIAYDMKGNAYYGDYVNVKVDVKRYLYLGGVSAGQSIDGSVTLRTSRNFNVSETEYVAVDDNTGAETVLYKAGYGSYSWFPGPDMAGSKELYVRVKDTAGNVYTSGKVKVNVVGTPKILLQSVGPGQVVTGTFNLNVKSNVTPESVKYILTNLNTGASTVLTGQSYTPDTADSGSWSLRAEAVYGGKVLKTEDVKFTIYMDKIYTALPVVPKEEFMDFASNLAVDAKNRTGMSAALQTAQAILETGWGQSVPVDKYSGQFSNNLFGIKGTGSAGSVTSNTWEEYNGVSFRIDAEFRAYNEPKESWNDHKELLLTKERYAPFRAVMFDSTEGAWALRRSGYATDSSYAIKLIDIINRYDLRELDKVGI
ncbi:MAG: glucosaminidase domain-containing protein [Sedimentibacter sp.]